MADLARLFDFVSGDVIRSSEVDAEFSQLVNRSNVHNAQVGDGLAAGSFSAYRNTALSVATATAIIFDTEEWDVSSWFNVANGRFTPQVAGYYRLSGILTANSGLSDGQFLNTELWKNGALYKQLGGGTARTATQPRVGGSALVAANGSTDYFTIVAQHNGAGSIPLVAASAAYTYFQGELVGRS